MNEAEVFLAGLAIEVRGFRARKRWSQRQLAARVPRLTANGVSEIENRRANPAVTRVMILADVMEMTTEELVSRCMRSGADALGIPTGDDTGAAGESDSSP